MQARTHDPGIKSLMLCRLSNLGESLIHDSLFPFANGRELWTDSLPMDVL